MKKSGKIKALILNYDFNPSNIIPKATYVIRRKNEKSPLVLVLGPFRCKEEGRCKGILQI